MSGGDYEPRDRCDFCGSRCNDLMPSFWRDRTRWFCGIGCLNAFKAAAALFDDEVLDGKPGDAKKLLDGYYGK